MLCDECKAAEQPRHFEPRSFSRCLVGGFGVDGAPTATEALGAHREGLSRHEGTSSISASPAGLDCGVEPVDGHLSGDVPIVSSPTNSRKSAPPVECGHARAGQLRDCKFQSTPFIDKFGEHPVFL